MALDFPLGLAALRLAVNLARFTKTRVCLSCFGSTNSGHAALYKLLRPHKSWALCKCLTCHVLILFPTHPLVSSALCFSSAVQADPRTFLRHPSFDAPCANESEPHPGSAEPKKMKKPPLSEHFWTLSCGKFARCCCEKHICKSKCQKHDMFGTFLDLQISNMQVKNFHNHPQPRPSRSFRPTRSRAASWHVSTFHFSTSSPPPGLSRSFRPTRSLAASILSSTHLSYFSTLP